MLGKSYSFTLKALFNGLCYYFLTITLYFFYAYRYFTLLSGCRYSLGYSRLLYSL